jgi:trigger factor
MKISNEQKNPTHLKYTVNGDTQELAAYKDKVIAELKGSVKIPGFRPGKAPLELVEKHLDPEKLQTSFLNLAVNELYGASIDQLGSKVVSEPSLSITKFVPFSTLEFGVEVDVITKIAVPDYKKFNLKRETLKVTKEQLDTTISELQRRTAKYIESDKPVSDGDQVTIDFKGTDAKTKEELATATGMDYKLIVGSKTFIPGFEEKLLGLKVEDNKDFDITFPSDYHDQSFKSRKVHFSVTVRDVSKVELPKLDDKFAANIGPFKTYKEFETELNRQMEVENKAQAERRFEDDILNKLAETTKVELPESLIEAELAKLEEDARQNAIYRGQTWDEFLGTLGVDQEGYQKQLRPFAESRIKGGLAIGEIATIEKVEVTGPELREKLDELKKQYTDPKMQAELEDPKNQREILMRLLTEKVLGHIKDSQSAPALKAK